MKPDFSTLKPLNATPDFSTLNAIGNGSKTEPPPLPATSNNQLFASLRNNLWNGLVQGGEFVTKNKIPGSQLGTAVGTSLNSIYQSVKQGSLAPINEAAQEINKNMGKIVGDTVQAGAIPATLALGGGTGATVLSRIGNAALKYGAAGTVTGGSSSLAQGNNAEQAISDAAKGGILSAGFGAVGQGIAESAPWVAHKVTQLLAKTSQTPEEAFSIMNSRPTVVSQIGVKPPQTLKDTQAVVRGLRKDLTTSWEVGTQKVIDEFSGERIGLPSKLENLLTQVDEKYALDFIPSETASMSAKELIDLQTEVNALASKPALKISPEGVPIRKLADELKTLGVQTFGGSEGSYATLYKNYAAQKQIFDAANDIVSAYKTGKPISQATALARLTKLFDENKIAYLQAIKDLEARTGEDVLSKIAASKFTPIAPKTGESVFKNLLEYLFLPLTSPRIAGWFSRVATSAASNSTLFRSGLNLSVPAVSAASGSAQTNNSQ